ncbi:MAG TPA: LuxR C-terminal-related transcriptional regulator [Actinoplanes sp.]|nr:LuxR C-terminal-related transcriptional regulator [Actinoplanes sp.]
MELWAVIAEPLAQRGVRQLAGELGVVRTCVVVDSAAAVTGSPDVVLPVDQSPTVLGVLAGRYPTVAMLAGPGPEQVRAAWRAGVRAMVSTGAGADELRAAIRAARAGGGYLCRATAAGLRAGTPAGPVLSARERETVDFIARGLTHAQTARMLGVSEATVHAYVSRVRGKLTAGNQADLVRRVLQSPRGQRPGSPG